MKGNVMQNYRTVYIRRTCEGYTVQSLLIAQGLVQLCCEHLQQCKSHNHWTTYASVLSPIQLNFFAIFNQNFPRYNLQLFPHISACAPPRKARLTPPLSCCRWW